MPYTYDYPRPSVSVDGAVLALGEDRLRMLLVQRGRPPFQGQWALPGGFVELDETLEESVRRELREETGLRVEFVEQLQAYGDPGRDPRGPTVSVAHLVLVRPASAKLAQAGDDARQARWFPVDELPPLAFDHDRIVRSALERLRWEAHFRPLIFELLPEVFTMEELQAACEMVMATAFEKHVFRQQMFNTSLLQEVAAEGPGHAAPDRSVPTYRLNQQRYRRRLLADDVRESLGPMLWWTQL